MESQTGQCMDCKEFEKMIPDFTGDKLNFKELQQFIKHLDECGNCREELAIQFLVTEGIQRLEEGSAFDLQSELNQRLETARGRVRFVRNLIRIGTVLEMLAVAAVAAAVLWAFL